MERTSVEALLERAKAGDGDAQRQVAVHTFNQYRGKIAKLYTQDPAVSLEDLEMVFFEAIFAYIPKLDHRGNPLFHLAQRGRWAAQSEVRSVNIRMRNRARLTGTDDDGHPMDPLDVADRTEHDFREIICDAEDADRVVRIVANANLRPRQREAMDLILSGEVGEPGDPGFNQTLAKRMDISPQRTSQIMGQLEATLRSEAAIEDRFDELRHRQASGTPWWGFS